MQKKLDQSGSAAILFTMFIIVIVSLIAIGFGFLVRTDQRATLDKTLSNQAQYAAESAINKISLGLTASPSTIPATNATCNGGIPSQTPGGFPSGVSITCLTWSNTPDYLMQGNLDTNPWVTPIQPTSAVINSFVITWQPSVATDSATYASPITNLQLAAAHIPVLKIVVGDSTMSGASVAYLIPSNVQTGDMSGLSGNFIYASCSGSPLTCTATISKFPGAPINAGSSGYVSINALGSPADNVIVKGFSGASGNGNQANFVGSQVIIDATARAQDVTKRLQASVSLVPSSWRPSFALSGNVLCKNFEVDGVGNDQPGPASSNACP